MNILLILSFLFFIGSMVGWILELIFRRFFSDANPQRKWINPGFLVGPYLPLYGFSLCFLYLLAHINITFIENDILEKTVLFIIMSIVITIFEYIAGLIFIVGMKVKLWDYTNEWGNIKGIICPKFSFYWMILSAIYYFLIHPNVLESLYWLSTHLTFSFFIGFFYGVFTLDVCYSCKVLVTLRNYANEHEIIIKYMEFQQHIAELREEMEEEKKRFFFSLRLDCKTPIESLNQYKIKLEKKMEDKRSEFDRTIEKIKYGNN